MKLYMQREDVKRALHVEAAPNTIVWPLSGMGFNYTKEYYACNLESLHL
jgi:hypothetical protein